MVEERNLSCVAIGRRAIIAYHHPVTRAEMDAMRARQAMRVGRRMTRL